MLIIDIGGREAHDPAMSTSLYVLRNEATTLAFRHDSLDEALDALNYEVGERDLWVLFELDRIAARRVAEGRGHVKCLRGHTAPDPAGEPAVDAETAYEWRRLIDRRKN
jgi:hypothetical protein